MSIDTIIYDKNSNISGIALCEGAEVKELEIIDENQAISGNIYLGKISRKIALAQDREGFFVTLAAGVEAFLNADEYGVPEAKLTEGQSIVVQVSQDKRAEKNARLVRAIQLAGKYLVYCPYRLGVEASHKIEDKTKAGNYIDFVKARMTGQEGWVLRTASVEVPFDEVAAEMDQLRGIYENVRIKARSAQAPSLLYAGPDALDEILAHRGSQITRVITNNRNVEQMLAPKYGDAIQVVISSAPFEEYGIEEVIGEALEKNVNLRGGGRITIEETRACVAIDVDSGRDSGGGSLNRINEEAAKEIAKQIRLRNLSGKIVIDFAGHSDYRFVKPLLEILYEELRDDSAKSHIAGLTRGGLVEILRVRRRPSLQELMSEECPTCRGTGRVEKGE